MWVVVTLLAVDPDTYRGICEEGVLPRGGVNEQVFSLQLVGWNQMILGWAGKVVATDEFSITLWVSISPSSYISIYHLEKLTFLCESLSNQDSYGTSLVPWRKSFKAWGSLRRRWQEWRLKSPSKSCWIAGAKSNNLYSIKYLFTMPFDHVKSHTAVNKKAFNPFLLLLAFDHEDSFSSYEESDRLTTKHQEDKSHLHPPCQLSGRGETMC